MTESSRTPLQPSPPPNHPWITCHSTPIHSRTHAVHTPRTDRIKAPPSLSHRFPTRSHNASPNLRLRPNGRPLGSISFATHSPSLPLNEKLEKLVGAIGFEPTTSWSQTRRSTKLSYTPKHFAKTFELTRTNLVTRTNHTNRNRKRKRVQHDKWRKGRDSNPR